MTIVPTPMLIAVSNEIVTSFYLQSHHILLKSSLAVSILEISIYKEKQNERIKRP